jgi:peptidyl-tRNA hydrolase
MPSYSVTVTRTKTIEATHEFEVKAKDEEAAEAKVLAQIEAAQESGKLNEKFDWEEVSEDESFDYQVTED